MWVDGVEIEILSPEEVAAQNDREQREISDYWDRYYALPFREQIREEGPVTWLLSTNRGILLSVAALIAAAILLPTLG